MYHSPFQKQPDAIRYPLTSGTTEDDRPFSGGHHKSAKNECDLCAHGYLVIILNLY